MPRKSARSSWNHRVMHFIDGEDEIYQIHEVYYDAAGNPTSYTEGHVGPCGETMEVLAREIEMFKRALELPVLTPADFPGHA